MLACYAGGLANEARLEGDAATEKNKQQKVGSVETDKKSLSAEEDSKTCKIYQETRLAR